MWTSTSQPELTTTSLSLYIPSHAFKAEICLAVKCLTFHYSQRGMDEMPDLLVMIFPDFQIAGDITLGLKKFGYFINHRLKKYVLEECMGW